MGSGFKYLFSSLNIGTTIVKNRFVFLPHVSGYCSGGLPDERQYYYFLERARGGVGLIIMGGQVVHSSTLHWPFLAGYDGRIVPIYRRISEAVHQYGTKIISQLSHGGNEQIQDRQVMWAPSAVPDPFAGNEIPRAMDKEDIQAVISGFVASALLAKEGGCDGVEIKASHDGLLREFWSPSSNLRHDEYGGSLDNRNRLMLEILKGIRDKVGPDFIIGVRPCLDELKKGGYTLEEGREIGKRLASSGLINYLNTDVATVGAGYHLTNVPMDFPPGCNVWAAAALKEVVDLPVIAAARINDPIQAEKILADGHADLIGMARQLLCDPETPNKAKEGRLDDIRHCLACNQGCFGNLRANGYIRCVHNPAASNEKWLGTDTLKTATPKKVVVVGGGPAGMKVAEIATRRGHKVVLFEKESELGGQVKLAEKGPKREDFGEVIHWLIVQIEKLGVKLITNVEATKEIIEKEKPDAVVIATGATPVLPGIVGADQDNVMTPWDVLGGGKNISVGQNVLVFCTWRTQAAASVAELLADQGKHMEIVTPTAFFGGDLPQGFLTPLYQRLTARGVVFTPFTTINRIQGNTVTLVNVFSQQLLVRTGIDSLVLSTPARANDELYLALKGTGIELHRVGDCVSPRDVDAAIFEGEMVGRAL